MNTSSERKLTNLEKKAIPIARRHAIYSMYGRNTPESEEFFLLMCKACLLDPIRKESKAWKVPFIQRQRFLELLHYYWLVFSRGLLPLPPL